VSFNWLDYVLIGLVATVSAIQFLRSTKDFSRVLYETLFIVGAVTAASLLLRPLGNLTGLPAPLLLGGAGVTLVVVGMILAAVLDRFVSFGLGIFSYVFGLVFAVACGYALGHLALRTANLAVSPHNPAFASAVRHSLMARDLLYFKTVTEILVFLRFVRWKGV
jgi:uncharacterized membrane protein required for colicin V production